MGYFLVLQFIELISLRTALFVRGYTLKRTIVRGGDKNADEDLEKGKPDMPTEAATAEEQGEDETKSIVGSIGNNKAGSDEAEKEGTVAEHTRKGTVNPVKT